MALQPSRVTRSSGGSEIELVRVLNGGGTPIVSVRHLSKHFGGARALDDVNLSVESGEVHGLLGHNGSGKSTLIRILSGYHAADDGSELEVNGQRIPLPLKPGQYRSLGFGFVHQDLGLIPSLSVVENLRIAELTDLRRLYIAWGAERRAARATMKRYGISLEPRAKVWTLKPWDRAALAIARAMNDLWRGMANQSGRGLLVLDEPTAFLPKERKESLYEIIREIAAAGAGVLFVSHDIDEVLQVTDRVTVLRDGRIAGSAETARITSAELIHLIVGHQLELLQPIEHEANLNGVVATVSGLHGGSLVDVSMEVRRGEVVGLTGILGSGFEEVPYFIFGALSADSGELRIDGVIHDLRSMKPESALASGIRLVPGDRRTDGSVGVLPVVDNVTLPVLTRFFSGFRLRRGEMLRYSRKLLERFHVLPNNPNMRVQDLSGGNQQKALLAKWFQGEPRLLLLDEPTQGVDVGARRQIFESIKEAAESGVSVVVTSSDHEQLAALCDRILVFRSGRVFRQLSGAAVTKQHITTQCYDVKGDTGS